MRAERDAIGMFWFCPSCGARASEETLSFNPALRELGFDKTKERKHIGVDGASGFIWHASDKKDADRKLRGIKKVKTEYGQTWSIARFRGMFVDVLNESYSDYDFS